MQKDTFFDVRFLSRQKNAFNTGAVRQPMKTQPTDAFPGTAGEYA